jgi:hypothetical protein
MLIKIDVCVCFIEPTNKTDSGDDADDKISFENTHFLSHIFVQWKKNRVSGILGSCLLFLDILTQCEIPCTFFFLPLVT